MAEPALLGGTFVADGPVKKPNDASAPHGHGPERFSLGVICETNKSSALVMTYIQPSEPAEHTSGRGPDGVLAGGGRLYGRTYDVGKKTTILSFVTNYGI